MHVYAKLMCWMQLQVMGKNKVLCKVHPEGKYVVDLDKDIDVTKVTTGARVALRNDSYTLHLLLPTKVDPLVSLMKVEKVPDSTYDMIGGLDQQIKEIKEVGACIWPDSECKQPQHVCYFSNSTYAVLAGLYQQIRT